MKQSKSELKFTDLSQADRDLVDKMVKGGSGQVTLRAYLSTNEEAEDFVTFSYGVCGGLAEYFNLDPTLVRIAFVLGTILTPGIGPVAPIAYIILAFIMGSPEKRSSATKTPKSRSGRGDDEERITIIKDR